MRVTLVRPPFYALIGVSNASHPLSLGYLSASLIEAGHDVQVVDGEALKYTDANGLQSSWSNIMALMFPFYNSRKNEALLESIMHDHHHVIWETIVKKIVDTRPDVIGITCFTVSMTSVKIIVEKILKALPGVKIVLGGIHVTSMPEQTLRDVAGVTCLVIGEGERTIVDLCSALGKPGQPLSGIKGLAFLTPDGHFVNTGRRDLISDIDDLPLPTRAWAAHTYTSHLGFTSRGCPFTCNFCDSRTIWTRNVRFVSQKRIFTELEQIDKLGIPFFRYSDDTFTLDRKRTQQWCNNVRERGYHKKIQFGFGTRVELITRECVEDYASAGVIDISFGIETGSERMRKIISKDFHGTDPFEAVKIVNEAGIGTRTYFMLGHPSERPQDVMDTIGLIRKMSSLPLNYAEVNVTCPYPGTELWKLAIEKTAGRPFVDIGSYYKMFHQGAPIVNLTDMSDEELYKWIQTTYKIAKFSALRSRTRVWGRQLFKNPVKTIRFIKERVSR